MSGMFNEKSCKKINAIVLSFIHALKLPQRITHVIYSYLYML